MRFLPKHIDHFRRTIVLLVLGSLIFAATACDRHEPVRAEHGMVVSATELASQVGSNILEACGKVTGGDGIHSLSGGCTETTPREHKTITESYRWEVFIR